MSQKTRYANNREILLSTTGGSWSCPACGTTNARRRKDCLNCGQRVRYSLELDSFQRPELNTSRKPSRSAWRSAAAWCLAVIALLLLPVSQVDPKIFLGSLPFMLVVGSLAWRKNHSFWAWGLTAPVSVLVFLASQALIGIPHLPGWLALVAIVLFVSCVVMLLATSPLVILIILAFVPFLCPECKGKLTTAERKSHCLLR